MTVATRSWLMLLIGVAFGLRVYRVDFGLPVHYHPDEVPATQQIVRALTLNRLMLHSYFHGPLLRELGWVVAKASQMQDPLRDSELATRVTLIMRWISVLAGSVSVLFVFLIAQRFLTPAPALFATALFATSPLVVFQSKYATPDALLCFFLLLGWWIALRLRQRPALSLYAAGGFVLALAIATKYSAVFLLFSLIAAHALASSGERPPAAKAGAAFVVALVLGLAVGFPLLPVEWNDFVRTTMLEADHQFVRGHRGIRIFGSEYFYAFHFVKSVLPACGSLLLAVIVGGLFHFGRSQSRDKWILLAAALPYYAAMEQVLKLSFSSERYVVPLLPLYFIAAAGLTATLALRLARGRAPQALAFVLGLVLASVPAYRTLRLLATMEPDTRARTAEWLVANVPAQASLAIGGLIYFYPPVTRAQFPNLVQFGRSEPEYSVASSFDYDEAFAYAEQTASTFDFYTRMFATQDLVFEAQPSYRSYMFHNPTMKVFRRRQGVSGDD